MAHLSQNTSNGIPISPQMGADHLLAELYASEEQLQEWLNRSEKNAASFAADPVAALRLANIGVDEEALQELASVLAGIRSKLA